MIYFELIFFRENLR